jgi:hypothetical protein
MTPHCRAVALDFDERLARDTARRVLLDYDMGALVNQAAAAEGWAGPPDVKRFRGGVRALEGYRRLAARFDRATVAAEVARRLANGRPLKTAHFVAVTGDESASGRAEWLECARAGSLTPRRLARVIADWRSMEAADRYLPSDPADDPQAAGDAVGFDDPDAGDGPAGGGGEGPRDGTNPVPPTG